MSISTIDHQVGSAPPTMNDNIRTLFESGVEVEVIARIAGIQSTSVFARARRYGWVRPPEAAAVHRSINWNKARASYHGHDPTKPRHRMIDYTQVDPDFDETFLYDWDMHL